MNSIKAYTLDKEIVYLNELYKNKNLLILFFNIQCLGCTGRAIPLAYKLNKEFKNIEVIAIHSNFSDHEIKKQDILDIFTIKTLPFSIYFDNGKKLFEEFKCEGTPHWILISQEGEIIRSIFGSQEGAQNRLYYALDEVNGRNLEEQPA